MKNLKKYLEENKKNQVPLSELPAPELLKNNMKAANRVKELILEGKRLLIVGDYDCDGIVATTIVIDFFREIGFTEISVDYLIPSRLKNGYGVSKEIIDYAKNNMFDFIVTVDNGISAIEAIEYAKEKNIEVIITDHHTPPEKLPDVLIVNPKVEGETFPYINISGATVAWYFVAALKNVFNSNYNLSKNLDLVGLTVMSDVMPMEHINISLINKSISLIRGGYRNLYNLIWNDWTLPIVNETSIAFNLVPMINAVGRISDANKGVELLLSTDMEITKELFNELKENNEKRKEMTREYLEISLNDVDTSNDIIVYTNKDFHEGLVGIVAGKLAEIYKKPSYVLSFSEEKDIWKGSARSYGDVHLYDLTNEFSDLILGFGGHKGAVGLSITEENITKFKKAVSQKNLVISEGTKDIVFESELHEMNMELLELLESYGPYGEGFYEPKFLIKNVSITIQKMMKGSLHALTKISDGKVNKECLFFNLRKELPKYADIQVSIVRKYDARRGTFSSQLIGDIVKERNERTN